MIDALCHILNPKLRLPANPNGRHLWPHPNPGEASCCSPSSEIGKTPLHHAVKGKNPDAIRILRYFGAQVDAKDREGRTPLYRACYFEYPECITALMEIGPNLGDPPNPDTVDEEGTPALLNAFGFHDIVDSLQALLDAAPTINVDATDIAGRTALHVAVYKKNSQAVKLLLAHNADVTLETNAGGTPFSRAFAHQHYEIVEIFIKDNPEISARSLTFSSEDSLSPWQAQSSKRWDTGPHVEPFARSYRRGSRSYP